MKELKLYPLWKEAVKQFITSGMGEPGSIVTEEWKQQHFSLSKPESGSFEEVEKYKLRMLSAFESFREELLTGYQVHLKSIGKGSHVVIEAKEQTREAWNTGVNDIKSAAGKMNLRLKNVDVAKLSDVERKENTDALVRFAMFSSMFTKVRKMEIEGVDVAVIE